MPGWMSRFDGQWKIECSIKINLNRRRATTAEKNTARRKTSTVVPSECHSAASSNIIESCFRVDTEVWIDFCGYCFCFGLDVPSSINSDGWSLYSFLNCTTSNCSAEGAYIDTDFGNRVWFELRMLQHSSWSSCHDVLFLYKTMFQLDC